MSKIVLLKSLIIGLAGGLCIFALASIGWTEETTTETPPPYMDQYLGADAEKVGVAVCIGCHGDRVPEGDYSHFKLLNDNEDGDWFAYGCEGCHGPGGKHYGDPKGILDPLKMDASEVTTFCSKCHSELGNYKEEEWTECKHAAGDLTCLSCHSGHSVFDKFLKNDNIPELCFTCHDSIKEAFEAGDHNGADPETMVCTDCHNPHQL
jgi:predicted CXXCH cytochrome family protein